MTAKILPFPNMTIELEKYPNRIREVRKVKGWSQARLGQAIGMTDANIGHLELGRRDPGLRTLRAIAAALGVTTAELLSEEDNPMNATVEGRQLTADWGHADADGRRAIARVAESFTRYTPEPPSLSVVESDGSKSKQKGASNSP